MNFVLRIYFYGLLALVPSNEQGEINILLVEARQPYALSNGMTMEEHVPMLIARAGGCRPVESCSGQLGELAEIIFPASGEHPSQPPIEQLQQRIQQGGAWLLNQSDLSLEARGKLIGTDSQLQFIGRPVDGRRLTDLILPASSEQAAAFDWLASMSDLIEEGGDAQVDPDVLSANPKKELIVGRLRLDRGRIGTYQLVEYENQVVPLEFRTLHRVPPTAGAPEALRKHPKREITVASQPRALADSVVFEIEIPGESVTLLEQDFSHNRTREMTLEPELRDGERVVEVAILNAPLSTFSLPDNGEQVHGHSAKEGAHFEIFYELLSQRPPNHLRPVPIVGEGTRGLVPQVRTDGDNLLKALVPDPRGSIARPICPPACLGDC